jgi:hypothetical protein
MTPFKKLQLSVRKFRTSSQNGSSAEASWRPTSGEGGIETSHHESAPCGLCNGLEKKYEHDMRLAFDFVPEELIRSAYENGCASCKVIATGIRTWAAGTNWFLERDVRRVYARCHGIMTNGKPKTLSLELYFMDERPKLELEFLSLAQLRK